MNRICGGEKSPPFFFAGFIDAEGEILISPALRLLEAARFVYHISRELDSAQRAGSSPQSDPVPQSGPVMEGDRHES